jgi:hypothetical protein
MKKGQADDAALVVNEHGHRAERGLEYGTIHSPHLEIFGGVLLPTLPAVQGARSASKNRTGMQNRGGGEEG